MNMFTKGLIIDEPWINMILRGSKTWEMRKTGSKIRGAIALIKKGSGQVVGTVNLVDSLPPLSAAAFAKREKMHGVPPSMQAMALSNGWRHPWVVADARPLTKPIPYNHPSGAVIWVNLGADVVNAIRAQRSN